MHYQTSMYSFNTYISPKTQPAYLCGGQTVADGEAIDCDLDLALVDHIDDSLGCGVHGDDRHGESSVCVSSSLLVVVTFHLVEREKNPQKNSVKRLPSCSVSDQ